MATINSVQTAESYRGTANRLGEVCKSMGVRNIEDIDKGVIERYMESYRHASAWTVSREIAAANKLLGTSYTPRDFGFTQRRTYTSVKNNRGDLPSSSTKFRWNLSGTYQQVLPRYLSVDAEGTEREFLFEALGEQSLGLIFLKGYQWPFDTRKLNGSSKIDLLVAAEIKKGRRVYLDFTQNPRGLENGFAVLPEEAYAYLERSGALFGTPIARLARMNAGAIELYADHGIDLYTKRLEIAVCAQHCNGGVAVDGHWQSDVKGLYAAGEAAGTFGVYRPGGSALNSTQVGALRAAEHIAAQQKREVPPVSYDLPPIRYGKSNVSALREAFRAEMSRVADFDRSTKGMQALFDKVCALCDGFFETAVAENAVERADLFRLYDMLLTQRATLSAMLCAAAEIGTHGAALVDGKTDVGAKSRQTRTLTQNVYSHTEPVSPIPSPELWFETLLARKRQELQDEKHI